MDGMVFEREGIGRTGMRLGPAVGMALMEELGIPNSSMMRANSIPSGY